MDFLSLWHGLELTLLLLGASAGCGLVLASLLTGLSFWSEIGQSVVQGYVFVMRGTPMLVQFYFIYYGLAEVGWLHDNAFLWSLVVSPITCSILALTLNTGAYTTVILRGAFAAIPKGEMEAAKAVGLSRIHIFRKITFPRALSMVLPVYSNEILMLLKGTSLASTITVLELTGVTEQLIGETYETILYWLVAGALYLAVSGVIIGIFKFFTQKVQRGQRALQPRVN